MPGFIKLSRDILDWGWYGDLNTRSVFLHLLLIANYEEKDYFGHKVKRGQAVVGLNVLAETLGISIRNVRTALKHLKSTNEVTIKTTNKFSIITICNFESLQGCQTESDTQSDTQSDRQVTGKRQASDRQVTTPEEVKKVRSKESNNNNNNYYIPPLPPPRGVEDGFLARIAEMEERQRELEEENASLKAKIENAGKDNGIDLTIVSADMKPLVEEWLAYKRQKRQGYKPMGFVKFYNKFVKDCGGDVSVARRMIDYSIANNYDGLFKPKDYGKRELPGQVIREEKLDFSDDNFFGL